MQLLGTDLTVLFPGRPEPVLDGATFFVSTGETVAILGPSGSGKSTLLSVLGGLVRPTSGTVCAAHDDLAPVEEPLTALTSWILQTTNVLAERTAVDNVCVAAQTAGLARRAAVEAALAALELVGLGPRADQRVRYLSGGEVQRVVTARALVSGRPFILADEPTGQLDRRSTEVVLDALFGAVSAGAGTTTGLVVVTHDPLVAERCHRTVRIENGKVVA